MVSLEEANRLRHAVNIIAAFVRNVHMKRVLHGIEPDPRLNFWRLYHGNCLDMAVIEWCKLFGSDHGEHQPVHWKNVVPENDHAAFRRDLFAAVGQSEDEWQAYWAEMKAYRDNHAAHFNEKWLRPENDPHYPTLDIALEAAYFYYDWLLSIMKDRGIAHSYPEDIRDYSKRFAEQARDAASKAISATAGMKERVL